MVAVQLSGGLGNQMFEYALYLKLRSLGKNVKIDDFTCYGGENRSLQLEVFGIAANEGQNDASRKFETGHRGGVTETAGGCDGDGSIKMTQVSPKLCYDRLTRQEYVALTDSDLGLAHKVRRKLKGRKDLSYREYSVNFDPEVLRKEPALLLGCFQTEKYFADISDQVRDAYRFRNLELTESLRFYERQMEKSESVSVHIRRGDYLDPKYSPLYAGICDEAYYERAIARMKALVPGARFFFFSNDTAWVKAHYQSPEFVVVEGNDEDSGYADLYLMSRCRHNIIANSSFSWWGAWLNGNPQKKVIAPKRWLNRPEGDSVFAKEEMKDIYTEDMILL